MEQISTFKLIFKSKEFLIPSNFPNLTDVNPRIIDSLQSNRFYIVQSNVSKNVFRSFIYHWVYNVIPKPTYNNINEYELLSEEFDRMRNIIQLFKKDSLKEHIFSLINDNIELKKQIAENSRALKKIFKKYQHIIQILFQNFTVDLIFDYDDIKLKLFNACNNEDDKYVEILTRKKIEYNGLEYILCENEKTANVYRNLSQKNDIVIPTIINYENQDFVVIGISEEAFKNCNSIKSINFCEDSQLKIINDDSFNNSSLEYIFIPQHVTQIGNNTFANCFSLQKVDFAENSELTKIGTFAFSDSLIKKVVIPPHVSQLEEFTFSDCSNLKKIEFLENSELLSISDFAFCGSSLKSLTIPSSVVEFKQQWCADTDKLREITVFDNKIHNIMCYNNDFIFGKSDLNKETFDVLLFCRRNIEKAVIPMHIEKIASYSFDKCSRLKEIEFCENSNLKSIEKHAFFNSSLEKITIPATVSELKNGWCCGLEKLIKVLIKPNNHFFSYLNNSFIIGRSSKSLNDNDYLIFARRNIGDVVIPSFIKKIGKFAFQKCKFMRRIVFTEDTKLTTIGKHSFSFSSLESIEIPSNVNEIGNFAFDNCAQLSSVIFPSQSKLSVINKYTFSSTSINEINIPQNVKMISEGAFWECYKLTKIEFSIDSKLKSIDKKAFACNSLKTLILPSSVQEFKDGWCYSTPNLTNIIILNNQIQNIFYFDETFLIGKSDFSSDNFDILLFVRRNVENVLIPPFIKEIAPYAFDTCQKLKKVEILNNSQLSIVRKFAFNNSSIKSISFPTCVNVIEDGSFTNCEDLKIIEFEGDNQIQSFQKNSFIFTSLELIMLPH